MPLITCKRCSSKYLDVNKECPICEKKYDIQRKISRKKAIIGIVFVVLMVLLFVLNYYLSNLCWYKGCYKYAGGTFCKEHTSEFNSMLDSLQEYTEYLNNLTKYSNLKIKNVSLDTSSSRNYYHASGSITNNGSKTVYYVKIKVLFKDSYGDVVDSDWTYAVASEGLSPGETVKWETSVKKDYKIRSVSAEVIDFNE